VTAAKKTKPLSVEDYLQGELVSDIKHEYADGEVFAMAGAPIRHNRIARNVLGALINRLEGQACEPFGSDMKIRIRRGRRIRFYYPDVSVICRSNPDDELFQNHPAVLFEVLSKSTRRKDNDEKKEAYLSISSLSAYVLVDQDAPKLLIYRRTAQGFVKEECEGLDAILALPEIKVELPLAEIYKFVKGIAK